MQKEPPVLEMMRKRLELESDAYDFASLNSDARCHRYSTCQDCSRFARCASLCYYLDSAPTPLHISDGIAALYPLPPPSQPYKRPWSAPHFSICLQYSQWKRVKPQFVITTRPPERYFACAIALLVRASFAALCAYAMFEVFVKIGWYGHK